MESSFQLMTAYDKFYYVKFTALSIKTIRRALSLIVLKILESGGVISRTRPRTFYYSLITVGRS